MKADRFERLSDMACNLGYTDHSHFIKDVKEFTGYTPRYLSVEVGGCVKMTLDRTLVWQRILIGHDSAGRFKHLRCVVPAEVVRIKHARNNVYEFSVIESPVSFLHAR